MATIGEGVGSPAIEQDPGIAQIQSRQLGIAAARQQVSLPATGFVASINAEDGAVTIQPGTSSTGVTVVVTNGAGTVSIGVTGISAAGTAKSNITAGAPGVGNDNTQGYAIFSLWIDNTVPAAPVTYICSDASTGAAVWTAL